jgi:hypothetical protein
MRSGRYTPTPQRRKKRSGIFRKRSGGSGELRPGYSRRREMHHGKSLKYRLLYAFFRNAMSDEDKEYLRKVMLAGMTAEQRERYKTIGKEVIRG